MLFQSDRFLGGGLREPFVFLFAHGTTGGAHSPWMTDWARRLSAVGSVYRFEYGFARHGLPFSEDLPGLVDSHRLALRELIHMASAPVVLVGKSLGAWVSCHVASFEPVSAVISLGFPLCSPAAGTAERGDALTLVNCPLLLVQGDRDPLCPPPLLQPYERKEAPVRLIEWVRGADHSLRVRGQPSLQLSRDEQVVDSIRSFLSTYV